MKNIAINFICHNYIVESQSFIISKQKNCIIGGQTFF